MSLKQRRRLDRKLRFLNDDGVLASPLELDNMNRPLLTDIEDRTLAMAEDEYVHFRIARPVLGTFYERNVSFDEISTIVGRLASLGLIRWRIRNGGHYHFRNRAPASAQRSCAAAFTASAAGKRYLLAPRHVTGRTHATR
jgi:hypothetical protein